jgi:hypothetical protein
MSNFDASMLCLALTIPAGLVAVAYWRDPEPSPVQLADRKTWKRPPGFWRRNWVHALGVAVLAVLAVEIVILCEAL